MPILRDIKLRELAYFKTGGGCDALNAPSDRKELAAIVKKLAKNKQPFFLLGGGSNSLVMDEPFLGQVIVFKNFSSLERQGSIFRVGAGITNTDFAEFASSEGFNGAGWMNRLPGQIGGTVRMNARCYGGEISQIVRKVDVITKDGELTTRSAEGAFRGYKDTVFMDNGDLITDVEMELIEGDTSETRELMKHCESDRIGKNQFAHPTCGCVFKNNYDVGVSSGILLDQAGVKEFSSGEAKINPAHANFVFNHGASSRDILDLTFKMREAVFEKFGVWLEYEMEILGSMPKDLWKRFSEKRPNEFNLELLEPLRESFRKTVRGNQL